MKCLLENSSADKLSEEMSELFGKFILQSKRIELTKAKEELKEKAEIVDRYMKQLNLKNKGEISRNFEIKLKEIRGSFANSYDKFNDKFMLFIVGNGKVGKSTLINALIGEEAAETNFLPTTWKIDVYYPDDGTNEAVVVYKDGQVKKMKTEMAKALVKEEEDRTKESKKKINNLKNKILVKLDTKEKRDEMLEKITRDNLYTSNIAEVHWPVKTNWLLEQCLLVDTPGLAQYLNDTKQIGSIKDYYYKADGVLWLLDGQTLSNSNTSNKIDELEELLNNVGGIRENIIGIINRIDLIEKDKGEEGKNKVIDEANKLFGNSFINIIPVSAKLAFEGVTGEKDNEKIEKSNIKKLQEAIKNIFILKADEIKNNAKDQKSREILIRTKNIIDDNRKKIGNLKRVYDEKMQFYDENIRKFNESIDVELNKMFNSYLKGVKSRVNIYVGELSEGKGIEFIKNKIYDTNELTSRINSLLSIKGKEAKRTFENWHKEAYISEYKYINDIIRVNVAVDVKSTMNLAGLNDIKIFTPSQEDDLISVLGNLWGKLKFFFQKASIINKLNITISEQCEIISNQIMKKFREEASNNKKICEEKLRKSFEQLVMPLSEIDEYFEKINEFEIDIFKEQEALKLKDLL